MASSFL